MTAHPLREPSAAPEAKAGPAAAPSAVLVIEADAATRVLLVRRIAAAGHRCESAPNLTEAAGLARRIRFDVVLVSIAQCGSPEETDQLRGITGGRAESALLAITERGNGRQLKQAYELGAQGFIPKPVEPYEVSFALLAALQERALHRESRAFGQRMQQEVLKHTKELLDTISRLERTELRIRRSQEETIYRLARAAEFRDNETGRHLQRMSQYSAILARRCGLDHDRCELIRVASPMHDIGKIGTPDQILYKNGKHTPEESEVMRQHAEIGYTILQGSHSELLETAAVIARTHHEKYDGSGYPHALAGVAIPVEGRVVAIADVFDALTSKRVYKPAFSFARSREIMDEGAGKHFDPALLQLFWEALDEIQAVRERFSDPEEHAAPAAD